MITLPKVKNEAELNCFLSKEIKNLYVNFINLCKNKKYNKSDGPFEYHHIIPLYAKGSNQKWNLIKLSLIHI